MIEDPDVDLEDEGQFKNTDIPDLKGLRVPSQNCINEEKKEKVRMWCLKNRWRCRKGS